MKFVVSLMLCLVIARSLVAETLSGGGTGLQAAIAADILGSFGPENAGNDPFHAYSPRNALLPREAEALFYAPIDHLFDGLLNMAAHNEDGEYKFEIHEMYISSSKLIRRSRIRMGKYFLGIGRLNQFHRHDWPFISAPPVILNYFGPEGANDSGIEYAWLTPAPFYLEVTAGVASGFKLLESETSAKPMLPTHYLRAVTYTGLPWGGGTQIGVNYLGRKDSTGLFAQFYGLDVTAKWREERVLKFLFQSEFWYRIENPRGGPNRNSYGFYVYPQYGLSPALSIGMRFDGFTDLGAAQAARENGLNNFLYGFVPTITYKASEFSTIRAAYTYMNGSPDGNVNDLQRVYELQAVFILGAHPAHDF